jgi:phage baseplate assembly protein W
MNGAELFSAIKTFVDRAWTINMLSYFIRTNSEWKPRNGIAAITVNANIIRL